MESLFNKLLTIRRQLDLAHGQIRKLWRGIREWCGDAAYESYLRSKHTKCCSSRPLSPEQFYVEQMDRKYSRPNRCC